MAFDKLVDSAKLEMEMTATAVAIRNKTGLTDTIPWEDNTGFANAVAAITVGGGSSEDVRYVTFMNEDGTEEYGKKAVATGDDCADPIARGVFDTPAKESTAQYNYTFGGWATTPGGGIDANALKSVTEDRTVYANFISVLRYYTITYYDGDGVTVLKTETLAYGEMPSYAPTKSGVTFNGWIPAATTVVGNASYTADWLPAVAFNGGSWEDIAQVVANGKASSTFALDETRTETVGEDTITLKIIGFDIDSKSDGSGKNTMTIMAYHNPGGYAAFDARKTYNDKVYWSNSDIRTYLNGEFFDLLPVELQSVIKSVKKKSSKGYNDLFIETTDDKIWLMSPEEMGATIADTNNYLTGQGTKYPGFIKNFKASIYEASVSKTWTRSIYYNSSGRGPGYPFVVTSTTLAANANTNCSSKLPYIFCFCI